MIIQHTPEEEKSIALMKVKVDALCEEVKKIPFSNDIKIEEENLFPFCYKIRLYCKEEPEILMWVFVKYAIQEVFDRLGPLIINNENFKSYIKEQDELNKIKK